MEKEKAFRDFFFKPYFIKRQLQIKSNLVFWHLILFLFINASYSSLYFHSNFDIWHSSQDALFCCIVDYAYVKCTRISFTYKQHEDKHMLFLSQLIELKLKLLTSFKENIFMLSIIQHVTYVVNLLKLEDQICIKPDCFTIKLGKKTYKNI